MTNEDKQVGVPPMCDITPPETMVLYGNNMTQWTDLLPRLTPVCRWMDGDLAMVRWQMPDDVAARYGVSNESGCAAPGCGCTKWQSYDGGLLVDTNWEQTGWFFDA
jgi:hypothetical protein